VVETATWQSGYCAVTGWIRAVTAPQDMQFRVNLPAEWNGRALQFGGGGFDGSLVTATGNYTAQPAGTYTFDPLQHVDRIQELGEIMDVTDVDLTRFQAYGGKVILTHGTIDDFITPHNTVRYYERQQERFKDRLDDFLRFYMVPGWGHGQGRFVAQYDGLGAIVDWVENGVAPEGLVARDGSPGADRTRPMCEYPAWPQHTGEGSIDDAESFVCVTG